MTMASVLAVSPGSDIYIFVVFLHILCVIVGFGSTFVWPLLAVHAKRSGDAHLMRNVSEMSLQGTRVVTDPFIYGAGATGLLMVILGTTADPSFWKFSDPWISIAMGLYIVGLGLSHGLHAPNLKRMLVLQQELAAGPPAAGQTGPSPQVVELEARGKKAGMFGGLLHLIFALILLDMVFKPF